MTEHGDRMTRETFKGIETLEADLWEAADNLRANSKLTSGDYFMPVLGIIFLRHAANRFEVATRQIEADQAAGRMPKRKVLPADYLRRRALWLPEVARYDQIMQQAAISGSDLPKLVTDAMTAIEEDFEPLQGVLPKDFGIFEATVLEDLMRLFNSEQIRHATGDVFGRIYEYFLAKFSVQKAHDNGEFFTPPSIVQTIVNVIEPNHGTVFDPASGSGGMFVQSSHFIEHEGGDTSRSVVFYGQEKNRDTIRLAKMNLAVHGLEGSIAEAITYYQDEYSLVGKCDFVMANPPFNVDLVDAERVKSDPRLPFGLPSVNKQKKVGNANYLWISYFWSYLNEAGRAGFVMSSQASSAGHGEKDVRKKIIESGGVDVMVSIRSNFFYTRSVPCELWFFDRSKPTDRADKVLMLDARHVFRKVTRKIYDFSPEQTKNLTAIVWLYRGQQGRFLQLVGDYLRDLSAEAGVVSPSLFEFEATLSELSQRFEQQAKGVAKSSGASDYQLFLDAAAEFKDAVAPYLSDRAKLTSLLTAFGTEVADRPLDTNSSQHSVRSNFAPIAEVIRGLVRQIDQLYKQAAQVADLSGGLDADGKPGTARDRRIVVNARKRLDEQRKGAVDQLRRVVYIYRQVTWLQDRFPDAELVPVPGLVNVVDSATIAAADYSLSPGRYVGVAPPEDDEDFDFEQTLRDIHIELADLNAEAAALASEISTNFQELGF